MTPVEKAAETAAKLWNLPPSEVSPHDISFHYTWLQEHRLFHVFKPDRSDMYVAVSDGGHSLAFQRMQKESNLEALNTLMDLEDVLLPDDIPPTDLAHTLRTLLWKSFGVLGSSALWAEQQRQGYNMWVPPSLHEGTALFQSYCRDPHLERHDGTWTLTFYYFSTEGGVEQWNVRGTAEEIHESTMTPVEAEGTFTYPYML